MVNSARIFARRARHFKHATPRAESPSPKTPSGRPQRYPAATVADPQGSSDGPTPPWERPHLGVCLIGQSRHGKGFLLESLTQALVRSGHGVPEALERGARRAGTHRAAVVWSQRRRYTLVGFPNDDERLADFLASVAQADAAILVISTTHGPTEATRRWLHHAAYFGIEHVVVALVEHRDGDRGRDGESEALQDLVELETRELLRDCGLDGDSAPIIRVTAPLRPQKADAPVSPDPREQHERLAHAMLEALDRIPQPRRDDEGPVFLAIGRPPRLMTDRRGSELCGQLRSGRLAVGDTVALAGFNKSWQGAVTSIRANHHPVTVARAGEHVRVGIAGLGPRSLRQGQVLYTPDSLDLRMRVHAVLEFEAPHGIGAPPFFSAHRPRLFLHAANLTATVMSQSGETLERIEERRLDARVGFYPAIVAPPGTPLVLRDSFGTAAYGRVLG